MTPMDESLRGAVALMADVTRVGSEQLPAVSALTSASRDHRATLPRTMITAIANDAMALHNKEDEEKREKKNQVQDRRLKKISPTQITSWNRPFSCTFKPTTAD